MTNNGESRGGTESSLSGLLSWVALLSVVGALLRAVHLDTTVAFDEAVTVRRFIEGGTPSIFSLYGGYGSTNNHVLNSLLSLASVRAFGEEVWALRLPAYVFGVLTVPLLGLFAWDLLRERTVAVVATCLAALSPILIEYSPACRGYAALLFFSVLSAWMLLRVVEHGERGKLFVLGLALFATGWSHMSGLIFLAACGFFLSLLLALRLRASEKAVDRRRPLWSAMAALGVATIALVIWYSRASLILRDVQNRIVHGEFVDPSLAGLKSVHKDGAFLSWIEHTGKEFFGTRGAFLPLTVPFLLLGAALALRAYGRKGWLLLCAVFVPPAALLAASLLPFPRYFLFVQPFALVLTALGLAWVGKWVSGRLAWSSSLQRACATGVLVLAFQGLSFPLLRLTVEGPGAKSMGIAWNVRALTDHLAREVRPEDLVVSFPQPRTRKEWREWGFYQTYEFHEQNRILPLLAPSLESTSTRRVWYATPNREILDPEYLPLDSDLTLAAEFTNCFLHVGEVDAGEFLRLELPPFDWKEGALGSWSFDCPFENASFQVEADFQGEPRITLLVGESGADAQLLSQPFTVVGGRLLEFRTEVSADQPDGMRPFGRIGFHFFDEKGERINTRTRPSPLWNGLRPEAGWVALHLTTVIPRSARTAQAFFALSLGNHAGCAIHFRPPILLGN